ncbi:MAG TPA: hypothetical protein VGX25_06770 [Actinophytocola sp.]|uniref:hypothetical protein n=1 Tax=Actinophytocola sp. TaxID=1872138 RepID=UPI002DDD2387|nr:hypothetical protein [Actinophytocola sp.]HEV2779091.1 hypothetical protein [Actinophytocola sp.]
MSRPWEFYHALYGSAGRHRGRRGPWRGRGKLGVLYGYTVVAAVARRPYGHSGDPRGRHRKRLHLVDGVWSVWRRGRCEGWVARWRCGGICRSPRLVVEREMQLCWLCLASIARQAEKAVSA